MAPTDWDIDDPMPSPGEGMDYAERCLWCAVIFTAVTEAASGDPFAQRWFQEPSGVFAWLCGQLGLPSALIRDQMKGMTRKRGRSIQFFRVKG